ncbi:MAG: esterase [Lachnospiraceae bacterium]|nr:esterase [Lachnospiraceae bacterium]
MFQVFEYGNPNSNKVIIQTVGDHDADGMKKEALLIAKETEDFRLIAVKVDNWNKDLSPWEAPPVFGDDPFGKGAKETLKEIIGLCNDKSKTYYIAGYSLAGLFALWAAFETDIFKGVAAVSPSVWFPKFTDYIKENEIKSQKVYLSLGDKEAKTRNPVMGRVADCINEVHDHLKSRGVDCTLEWNPGNHFKEPDLRVAKGIIQVLK